MTTQKENKTAWAIDPAHSSIEFAIKHMMFSTVKGQFGKYDVLLDLNQAHPEASKVEVRIDAASINTGEQQRDDHLRSPDFLDVAKYPDLTFRSTRIEPHGEGRYRLAGDLTIHGVTRQIALDARLEGSGKDPWGKRRAGFTVEGELNRKDFGLVWNAALETGGWLVGENVRITVIAELVENS